MSDTGHEVTYEPNDSGATFATCTCGWRIASRPRAFVELLAAEHQETFRGA